MEHKDLALNKNCTKAYELIFTKNGVAKNITDWTIYFVVKKNFSDSDAQAKINKKVTNHSDPTNGKTLIQLTASDTNLTPGQYYYSMDYKDDEGNTDVLFSGKLKIRDVTLDSRD